MRIFLIARVHLVLISNNLMFLLHHLSLVYKISCFVTSVHKIHFTKSLQCSPMTAHNTTKLVYNSVYTNLFLKLSEHVDFAISTNFIPRKKIS